MTHENMFGMFVHWGFYALTGVQEQAYARFNLDREEYEGLSKKFNPVNYDPEKWVLLAKEAGMEYITFTTKHHDGFCMWDTKETDYSIMNTPYGKDVLKMLADACAKHNMKLSLYYSCPDWNHPYGFNPASSHQWKANKRVDIDTAKYREYVKAQVKELLTGYGDIYAFYWDIPPKIYDPSVNELVRKLQPHIYINDRGYDKGDFSTPEREYSTDESKRYARMTEACNSLGVQSWGYRKNEDFYTYRYLTSEIDRNMAKGASYVLNVGPNELGEITEEYSKRLLRIGNWYKRMGGALKCHEEDTFDYGIIEKEYYVTTKNGKSYFHFPQGLMSNALSLRYFPNTPKSVRVLNTGDTLTAEYMGLPEYSENGMATYHLHIRNIPTDDIGDEPIVIEIQW